MSKTNYFKLYLRIFLIAFILATAIWGTSCGEEHSHSFGEWEIVTKATCQATGVQERICSCGEMESEVVPVISHIESLWVTDATPTCTLEGRMHTECMACGVVLQTETIPCTSHREVQHEAQAPACTEIGWNAYVTCETCDYSTYKEIDALGHTEVIDSAVVPTCTKPGLTDGKHCSICGEILVKQTEVSALGHIEVIDAAIAPTCTVAGLTEGKHCSVCDKILVAQEEVSAFGHTEVIDSAITPTCADTGLTEGKHCSVCGEILVKQTEVSALGHAEVIDSAITPTCADTGLTEGKHCSVCGKILVAQEEVSALGHTEVVDTAVAPTCTDTGLSEGKHCLVCGKILVAQEEVSALGHTEVVDTAVVPTCTDAGLTEGKHCSVCGEILVKQTEVSALGHTEVVDAAIVPTCSNTGLTEGKHCSVCGEILIKQTEVSAFGHTEIVDTAVAPTCTDIGLTEGKHCSACGEILVKQTEVSALGHTEVIDAAIAPTCTDTGLTEGKHCSVCGEILVAQEEVSALGHTEVVDTAVAPTCTDTGLTEGKHCSACGKILVAQEEVSALGHTEVVDTAVAPTCTDTGLTEGKHCSVCGEILVKQTEVSALGHTEVIDAAIAPTCTVAGLTEGKHCLVCGKILVAQEEVSALGHTEVVDTAVAPTCTDTGLTEGKHCSVCGEILVEQTEVSALGHTEAIDAAIAPTCTDTGLTEGKHCSVCGEILVKQTEVSALGHTEAIDSAVAPTCTDTGLTEGKHCSVCGKILAQQTEIAALQHRYADNYTCHDRACLNNECRHIQRASTNHSFDHSCDTACNSCGFTRSIQHVWEDKPKSDNEYHWIVCTVCAERKNNEVHNYTKADPSSEYQVSEATCENPALYVYCCQTCGAKGNETFSFGDPLGHEYDTNYTCNADMHWRQCTRDGCKDRTDEATHGGGLATCFETAICSSCGTAYESPLAHEYTNKIAKDIYLKTPATCVEPAVYYFSCIHCGDMGEECFAYGEAMDHEYSSSYNRDGNEHWRACVRIGCNAIIDKAPHSGGAATCLDKASCAFCRTEYGSIREHHYTSKIMESAYLKSAATCEEVAIYYYACIWCGEKSSEFYRAGEPLGHNYNTHYSYNTIGHWFECSRSGCESVSGIEEHCGGTATCTEKASCSLCGAGYGKTVAHDFSDKITSSDYLKSAATCESPAVYYFACVWCKGRSTDTYVDGEALGHDYSPSYERNANEHWRVCVRDGCGAHTEEAPHQGGNATCQAPAVCTFCGVSYGSIADHNYTKEDPTEYYLKSGATCKEAAIYYFACEWCNSKSDTTYAHGEALGHNYDVHYSNNNEKHWRECSRAGCDVRTDESQHFGGEVSCTEKPICDICKNSYGSTSDHNYFLKNENESTCVKAATCEDRGIYYLSCVCGAIGTKTFDTPALNHMWEATYHPTEDGHYQICSREGCAKSSDSMPHTGGAPTCTSLATCQDCGASYGRMTDHVYDKCIKSELYFASAANCETAATYYYSCVCGEKGESTFADGDSIGHSWSLVRSYNDKGHYYTCKNGCGNVFDESPHQMGAYVQTIAPTCSSNGEETSTCTDCAYTMTQSIKIIDHEWQYDQILLERYGESDFVIKIVDKCKNCALYTTISESSPHHHESYMVLSKIDPTCTEDGWTRGVICDVDGCDVVWIPQEVIPAYGHNYEHGLCTRCGGAEEVVEEFDEDSGLSYRRNSDGTYTVTGSGTKRNIIVNILATYKGIKVTGIADEAFRGQSQIQSLKIGTNVTSIGAYAFADLTKITTITIGTSVTSMGVGAFDGCTALKTIYFNAINMEDLTGGAFNRVGNNAPSSELIIGTEVKRIPANLCASEEGNSIQRITFNNVSQCVEIGSNAFYNCSKLQIINLPKSMKSIGDNAFQGCNSLLVVDYLGNDADWEKILIGSGNEKLLSAYRT